jgi:hypothetical protein
MKLKLKKATIKLAYIAWPTQLQVPLYV